jgi:hypothetical protein
VQADVAAALERCRARLDAQALYPRPLRMRFVRVAVVPWLFRLPWFRRFDGYTMWDLILLRKPFEAADEDLLCHELCHVWQMQHRPLRMPLSYLVQGYARNRYEVEARRAVGGAGGTHMSAGGGAPASDSSSGGAGGS